jgi:hypothetical protein
MDVTTRACAPRSARTVSKEGWAFLHPSRGEYSERRHVISKEPSKGSSVAARTSLLFGLPSVGGARSPSGFVRDWFLAESLVREYRQTSPFDEFLWKATKTLNEPTITRGVRNDAEYARVIEERRYVIDILDRVEMLAFTFSRLIELSSLYREAEARLEATSRVTGDEPLTWEASDEIVWQRDSRALEAAVLVSFVYYELTSLAHMLEKGLKLPIPQGELQYLVKARDKFLAHPVFHGRVRNAHGAMSIPKDGLLHPHATKTDPVLFDYYGSSFAPKSADDEASFRVENEKLILSSTRKDRLTSAEKLRLKAFGIREPSLEASLKEMASLLLRSALPEIDRIAAQPIPSPL